MKTQASLVDVPIPDDNKFTVIGDIHGQYYDLINIFKLNGLPSPTNPYVKYFKISLLVGINFLFDSFSFLMVTLWTEDPSLLNAF